jgi:hypothetical protein
MKKIVTAFCIASLLIFLASSCKKNDKPKSTADRIHGLWTIQNVTENYHYSGQDHIDVTPGGTGDYIDFRTDGNAYSSFSGYRDTASYSIISDSKISIEQDLYDIKSLTDNSFVLYTKDDMGSEFDELTISLKR